MIATVALVLGLAALVAAGAGWAADRRRPALPTSAAEWLKLGQANGWCGKPWCAMHDSPPALRTLVGFERGDERCQPAVRVLDADGRVA